MRTQGLTWIRPYCLPYCFSPMGQPSWPYSLRASLPTGLVNAVSAEYGCLELGMLALYAQEPNGVWEGVA